MKPMLLSQGPIPNGSWAYEIKWDGVRALWKDGRLTTRNGNDVTDAFPDIAVPSSSFPRGTMLDGEIVTFVDGKPHLPTMTSRVRMSPEIAYEASETSPAAFVVFDMLTFGGRDLTGGSYDARRTALEARCGVFRVSPRFSDGPALFEATRAAGLEGIVSKHLGSRYYPGGRSVEWLKHRHPRPAR